MMTEIIGQTQYIMEEQTIGKTHMRVITVEGEKGKQISLRNKGKNIFKINQKKTT